MSSLVKLVVSDRICTLSLNRPDKLNAINKAMTIALRDALGDALARDDVGVIILRGEGRAFCAGNDLEASAEQSAEGIDRNSLAEHARDLQEVTRRICFGDKVVIGAIHGWAVGAGFEWALNCDFTVWGASARAFLPEIRLGVFPTGGAMVLLPRLVGLNKAREMFLLGDEFSASQLADLGIATRVVDDAEVLAEAESLARRVLELPGDGVARLKRTLARTQSLGVDETLDIEAEVLLDSVQVSAAAGRSQDA